MRSRPWLAACALALPLAAQQNSSLPRGDVQLSQVAGVINDAAGNLDAGFNTIDVTAPREFVAAGPATVCTANLVYSLYPDRDAQGRVVLRVRRSTDGGFTWLPPVTVYTADTANGEDLNTGDEGTHLIAFENHVWVTVQTNAHNKLQQGQSLWVVGSIDQGQTWSAPFDVSTGWNRPAGNRDWDVDLARGAAGPLGLHLVWEADFEDPLSPGNANAAPNNNENLYYALVGIGGPPSVVFAIVPETPLTTFAIGTFDVDDPTIAVQGTQVLVAYVDDAHAGLAPGGNCTLSRMSFDAGFTFAAPFVHSGLVPATFSLAWAQPRRPFAVLDGQYAFVVQEDSRVDQDDVWMDRGDLDVVNGVVNWTVANIRCNHTSSLPGSGDVDGILVAAHDGVLAILYRDDSAGTPLDDSNEAYLVVDRDHGNEFIAGTFQRHTVTTSLATIYDLQVVGNVICGVYECCPTSNEEGGIVLSHDRGTTIEARTFTTLGSCGTGTIDVDDLQCAVTRNGDYAVVYADERLGGAAGTNANNAAFVTGGKLPRLRYDAAAQLLALERLDPQQAGVGIAFLMISGSTGPPNDLNAFLGLPGAGRGHVVNLGQDPYWFALWNIAIDFVAPLTAGGVAQWNGVPNATALFGVPIHVAAGTVDVGLLGIDLFLSYSDPILQ